MLPGVSVGIEEMMEKMLNEMRGIVDNNAKEGDGDNATDAAVASGKRKPPEPIRNAANPTSTSS